MYQEQLWQVLLTTVVIVSLGGVSGLGFVVAHAQRENRGQRDPNREIIRSTLIGTRRLPVVHCSVRRIGWARARRYRNRH